MSEEQKAALVDPLDTFVQGDDQAHTEVVTEATPTESAPVDDATEQPEKTNGVQDRINKITADKHEERRKREAEAKRADGLQKKVDELEAKKPTLTEPKLEEHDYDEDAFNKATIKYQVQEDVKAELAAQKAKQNQTNQEVKAREVETSFNEQATALGKDDFDVKAQSIPELPAGVADAIKGLDNGAEMVYHLGTHLDLADSLANMTPLAAMMELGKISSGMPVKPEIKTSAAPDPITPIGSGGSALEISDEDMSMDQWMAKYG